MNALLMTVLSLSLSGTLLAGLLFLARAVWHGPGHTLRYILWIVVLARLLLPFSLPLNPMAGLFAGVEPSPIVTEPSPVGMETAREADYAEAESAGAVTWTPAARPPSIWEELTGHLGLVWLAGVALMLVHKATSYRGFLRFIRSGCFPVREGPLAEACRDVCAELGIRKRPALYVNRLAASPMLVGLLRPFLVLPQTELTGEELRYVFRHELTHYRRRDLWFKWLAQLAVCVHWFNPAVYLAARQLGRECELSCDESLLRPLDTAGRRTYGDTLLHAVRGSGSYSAKAAAVTLNEDYHLLTERLKAIMNYRKLSRPAAFAAAALAAAFCFTAAAFGAYAPPVSAPAAQGQSDYSTPEAAARSALDALRRLDMKTFNAHSDNWSGSRNRAMLLRDLRDKDVSVIPEQERTLEERTFARVMEGMSYTLEAASRTGSSASVPVTVTSADLSGVIDQLVREAMRSDGTHDDDNAFYRLIGEAVDSGKTRTKSFTLRLKLDGGQWKLHVDGNLVDAVMGFDSPESPPLPPLPSLPSLPGIMGEIAQGVTESIIEGIYSEIYSDWGDADWTYNSIIDLPDELYREFEESSAESYSYGLFLDEPMRFDVEVAHESGTFTLAVMGGGGETAVAPSAYETPESFTLQPGTYRLVLRFQDFTGSCHVVGMETGR